MRTRTTVPAVGFESFLCKLKMQPLEFANLSRPAQGRTERRRQNHYRSLANPPHQASHAGTAAHDFKRAPGNTTLRSGESLAAGYPVASGVSAGAVTPFGERPYGACGG